MTKEMIQSVRSGVRVTLLPLNDTGGGILICVAKNAGGAELNINKRFAGKELDVLEEPGEAVEAAIGQLIAAVNVM